MEDLFFRGLALLYTTLIVCGTMLVPGYIVNSKIILLKELLIANPDSSVVTLKGVQKYNSLPEKDLHIVDKEVLWSAK
jgi:hypothetical protein